MNDVQQIPLWLQRLWKTWLVLIAILFAIRFAVLNAADEDARFFVFAAYAIISWLPLIFINMYVGIRLDAYLRKHHKNAKHLWSGFGPLAIFRRLSFLRSPEDLGDAEVGRLKQEYKAFLRLAVTVFLTMPFLFIAFMLGARIN